jgi:hypothetical protein
MWWMSARFTVSTETPIYHRPRQRKILDDHEHSETTILRSENGQFKIQRLGAERDGSNDCQEVPA